MTSNMKKNQLRVSEARPYTMCSEPVRSLVASMAKQMCFGLLAISFSSHHAFAGDDAAQLANQPPSTPKLEAVAGHPPKRVNFEQESASPDARHVANWVVDSGDNGRMPFVIIDKRQAKVFVFNADGRLRGAAPALLGLAQGDDSIPGIGERKLSSILPEERTTPAGRFVAALGRNLHKGEILWIDYKAAISLHPVITTNLKERRAQRLATPTPLDNRISYGCINVPAKFFKRVVSPAFKRTNGIVYVLPETRSPEKEFASYDVDERAQLRTAIERLPARVAAKNDVSLPGQ